MFYGLAWYINSEGTKVSIIIRNLQSKTRRRAEKEARRIATMNGYIFDSINLAKNYRQKQGEIKQNYSLPRERAFALQAWRG